MYMWNKLNDWLRVSKVAYHYLFINTGISLAYLSEHIIQIFKLVAVVSFNFKVYCLKELFEIDKI